MEQKLITVIIINLIVGIAGMYLLYKDFHNNELSTRLFGYKIMYYSFTVGMVICFTMGAYQNSQRKNDCPKLELITEPIYKVLK